MKSGSNAHYGYPITSLRELPFDKSGSQFVNELPKTISGKIRRVEIRDKNK